MKEIIHIHFDTIDSTNTYAKKHVTEFDSNKITCITADGQTAGRGRFQRSWVSPKGVNLYATYFFQLPAHTPHLISLAQVMAISLARALLAEGLHPKIKWPNDLLLNGKKISGILCETGFDRDKVNIFLGIGINVNMELFNDIDQPASSLKQETGHLWDRASLLKKFEKQFVDNLDQFKKEGFAPFHALFEELLAFKGETIRCFDGTKTWVGICHSIAPNGQLNIFLPNNTLHTILSGDII